MPFQAIYTKYPILLMPTDFKQENQNFFLFKNILNMHTCNHLIQLFFSKSNNECLILTTNSFSILFRKITPAAVIWLKYCPNGVKHYYPINQS